MASISAIDAKSCCPNVNPEVFIAGGTFENGAIPSAFIACIRYVTSSPGESVVSEYDVVLASPKLVSMHGRIVPPKTAHAASSR